LARGTAARRYHVYLVTSDHHRAQAKALHAKAYLAKGFIHDHQIDEAGLISQDADPCQLHAAYFIVCDVLAGDDSVGATARQISADPIKGLGSLPILEKAHIENRYREHLRQYRPAEIVEFSGLAKAKGTPTAATFLLYQAMWSYSKRQQHKVWLMALDPSLYRQLKRFVGPVFTQIGGLTDYTGGAVIPAMVDIAQAEPQLARFAASLPPPRRYIYRAVVRFFMADVPVAASAPAAADS
jgi:hypothetical protein